MIRRRLRLGAVAVLALSWPLAGCVTVHGEQEYVPSVQPAQARKVLADFAASNNAATKAYDPAGITKVEAGPLGEVDAAGVRARHTNHPAGNPSFTPLVFSRTRFVIPRQRGWPKFFVADTEANRSGPGSRWLLVFRRFGADLPWKADYLAVVGTDQQPVFATDKDGYAQALPLAGTDLLVQPGQLSAAYTTYLQRGKGTPFAPGASTTQLRATRHQNARTPNSVTQYADLPAGTGDFDPVALRTKDGGALVFFASRHQSRSTYRTGYRLSLDPDTRALMTGAPRTSVTLSHTGEQAVAVPGGTGTGQVVFLSRLVGLVSAKGE